MARGKGNKRGGYGGKRFAATSAEEIEQRNRRLEELDDQRAKHRAEAADEDEDGEGEGGGFEDTAEEVGKRVAGMSVSSSGDDKKDDGPKVETRKQREEREKAEKAAAYRKRHEAGLTEEYKKDMAKLAEVRKRREAAEAKAKAEKEAAAAAEEERKKMAKEAGASGEDGGDEKKSKKKKSKSDIPKLDKITIKKMKPAQMKEALKERGLEIQGNAKALTDRLLKFEAAR